MLQSLQYGGEHGLRKEGGEWRRRGEGGEEERRGEEKKRGIEVRVNQIGRQ